MWEALFNLGAPWLQEHLWILFVIIGGYLFFQLVLDWWAVSKGQETSHVFGAFKRTPNKLIERQKEEFEKLNEDSKQKIQIVKLIDAINKESSKVLASEMTAQEFVAYRASVYQYFLPGILGVVTKDKANVHRVAIFVPAEEGTLKVHEGAGYSPDGKMYLRIKSDWIASKVFKTGEPRMSGDLRAEPDFRPHPKASKSYNSLLCTPIKCGNITIGVLNIDGEEYDSFTKDDQDYLAYFADALSIFLYHDLKMTDSVGKGGQDDEQSSDA